MSRIYVPRPYHTAAIHHLLWNPRCALWGTPGVGKQQPDSEPVLTPKGWVPMGALKTGDCVLGANGQPTQVLAVFPQGLQETVRVTFSDGAWCRVGWDHLWYVESPHQRKRGAIGHVMTTRQLVAHGLTWRNGNRGVDSFWYVPLVAPVEFPEQTLPLEPYLLGVILGDGTVTQNGYPTVCTDLEIIAATGLRELRGHDTCEYVAYGSGPGLSPALRELGLQGKRSWEKFVPEAYMLGSVEQRLALLQGLLDTDGSPIHSGGVEFSSTAEALVDAVVALTQSLGGVAKKADPRVTHCQTGEGRPSWRANVKLPPQFAPFRLRRKLDRWVRPTKYPPIRKMVSAEVEGYEHATCIKVAASDSLYVTRNYVVTHNTVLVLTALDMLYLTGESHPTLIIAPPRVARRTWAKEAQKWSHLSALEVVPILGSPEQRLAALERDAPIYTTNYENLVWLIQHWGSRWPYRIVVADEATKLKSVRLSHQVARKADGSPGKPFIRGTGGKRAVALGRIAHEHTTRFIELTGTPSPNGLKDLWGQLWYLDGGRRLGNTHTSFMARWFEKSFDGYSVKPKEYAPPQIHAAVADLCLSINAKDYFPLKDPVMVPLMVQLPEASRRLYQALEKKLFARLGERQVSAANAAVKSQKLLQVANGAVYLDHEEDVEDPLARKDWQEVHDQKLQALDSLAEELQGAPLIIVYTFWSDLQRLKKAFPDARVLRTKQDEEDFAQGRIPKLLVHPDSGGYGIDGFQEACHHMVFFSHSWNLESYLQVVERIGPTRQFQSGHDRNVFLYFIVAEDTIDEEVMESRESKRSVQDVLMEATKRRQQGLPSAWRERQEGLDLL